MAFARNRDRDRDRAADDVVAAAAMAASASQGNLPPHDLDAERAVLGGVLLDNSSIDMVEAVVTPPDFYHPSHAVIFESIQALKARSEPVDVVTLSAELRARERLNTVGGAQYLGELTDTIPTIAHIEQHARIVADLAQVRRMIAAAHEITARGYGDRGSADAFLDFAAARVFDIAQKRSKSSLIELHQAIQEAFERIEKTLERGARITGSETGFRDLDTLTAGMHPGQLIIIAARPAMGKTSLVLNIDDARGRSRRAKPVLFFSLEMPRVELANRMMCAEARVDQGRLRSNMLTQDDMTALTAAASKLFDLPIYIDDSGDLTLLELRAKARRMKAEKDLGLIVIDYLQLMKASRDGMESREREISEISRGLKALAKELEVPIIALSQLNRSPETRSGKDKRPQLSRPARVGRHRAGRRRRDVHLPRRGLQPGHRGQGHRRAHHRQAAQRPDRTPCACASSANSRSSRTSPRTNTSTATPPRPTSTGDSPAESLKATARRTVPSRAMVRRSLGAACATSLAIVFGQRYRASRRIRVPGERLDGDGPRWRVPRARERSDRADAEHRGHDGSAGAADHRVVEPRDAEPLLHARGQLPGVQPGREHRHRRDGLREPGRHRTTRPAPGGGYPYPRVCNSPSVFPAPQLLATYRINRYFADRRRRVRPELRSDASSSPTASPWATASLRRRRIATCCSVRTC